MQNKFPEWIYVAESLYKQGLPYKEIAVKLNKDRKIISYYLRQLGYKSNPKYTRIIDPHKLQKYDYTYAESLFEIVDTEDKAYWLGFLYADGYLSLRTNEIELSVKEEDLYHLKKFRSFLHLDDKPISKKSKGFRIKIILVIDLVFQMKKLRMI